MDKGGGGSVLIGPHRPHEHDFSQQSLSSLRSSTVVVTTNNNKSNNSMPTNNNNDNNGSNNDNSRELSNNDKLEVESDQPSQPMTSQTMITAVTTNTNNNDNNTNIHNNNNQDNDNDNNQDESQETQETFTQQLTQNDMTQLGFDSDNDDLEESQTQSQFECSNSPTPIDPLTVPWGRLMPVGLDNNDQGGANNGNGGRPSSGRGATEMLPRSPLRNDASSLHEGDTMGGQLEGSRQSPSSQSIQFLGLKNLLVSDRFNEYVLGRSVKVSLLFSC